MKKYVFHRDAFQRDNSATDMIISCQIEKMDCDEYLLIYDIQGM